MTRILDITDGFTSATTPTASGSSSKGFLSYANDAAYEAVYTPEEGSSYWNTTVKKIKFYDGTVWRTNEQALDNATTTNPTVDDDATEGYQVLSVWLNTSTGAFFRAVDVTEGAAVWQEVAADSVLDAHISATEAHGATGAVVGTTNTQTLTNKTIDYNSNTILNLPSSGVLAVQSKSANYTALVTDGTILCDSSGGTFTITLYTASGNAGKKIIIKKTDSSSISVVIDGSSAETIDGFLTVSLCSQNASCSLVSDGANWVIESKTRETAYIKDVKTSGTAGGTFTSGSWQTRTLNTISGDSGFLSLSSNQFTLLSGKYVIKASATWVDTDGSILKIRNVSDSSDAIIGLSVGFNTGTSTLSGVDFVSGPLTLSSSKTFELQHRATATVSTFGFGAAKSFGVSEIYAQVEITKLY